MGDWCPRNGGSVMAGDAVVELGAAIEAVRVQLVAAQQEGLRSAAGKKLSFAVGKVSIEFAGEVSNTVGASGGVKFWVVTAVAEGERASSASHKVTVELIPQDPAGGGFTVSEELDSLPSS